MMGDIPENRERFFVARLADCGLDDPAIVEIVRCGGGCRVWNLRAEIAKVLTAKHRRKETVFENVRTVRHAHLPSRRNCLFAFDVGSAADAETAAEKMNASRKFPTSGRALLEIEATHDAAVFSCDSHWLDRDAGGSLEDRAEHYWCGDDTDKPVRESLLVGSYRVVAIHPRS